jgi:hypothetical protein
LKASLQTRNKREEGRGKREDGRGKREEEGRGGKRIEDDTSPQSPGIGSPRCKACKIALTCSNLRVTRSSISLGVNENLRELKESIICELWNSGESKKFSPYKILSSMEEAKRSWSWLTIAID